MGEAIMAYDSVDMRAGHSVAEMLEMLRDRRSPLDHCLDLWVRSQERNDLGIGWRGRAVMLESEASASSEQLYDRIDSKAAEAVHAMVHSLSAQHCWAIKKRCGICSVWQFPSLIFADVLAFAEIELEKKLKINVATRNYFK